MYASGWGIGPICATSLSDSYERKCGFLASGLSPWNPLQTE